MQPRNLTPTVVRFAGCVAGATLIGGPLGLVVGTLCGGSLSTLLAGLSSATLQGAAQAGAGVAANLATEYWQQWHAGRKEPFNQDLARAVAQALQAALVEARHGLPPGAGRGGVSEDLLDFWIGKLGEAQGEKGEQVLRELFREPDALFYRDEKGAGATLLRVVASGGEGGSLRKMLWRPVRNTLVAWARDAGKWPEGHQRMMKLMADSLRRRLLRDFSRHLGHALAENPRASMKFQAAAFTHVIGLLGKVQADVAGMTTDVAEVKAALTDVERLRSEQGLVTLIAGQVADLLKGTVSPEAAVAVVRRQRDLYQNYVAVEAEHMVAERIREECETFVAAENEWEPFEAFLNENRSGLLLVTAPAGYGKSARLANLAWEFQARGSYFVARHFFSNRHPATASLSQGYQNLLRQINVLSDLSDEVIPTDLENQRSTLFGLLFERQPRPDRKLIVLVDGLDEADGTFSEFQRSLPDGVYLIVSVRAEPNEKLGSLHGWRERCPRPLCLDRAPRSVIRRWLARTEGLSTLAEDSGFVAELDTKTEGFPLHLKYLIADLAEAVKQGKDARALLATQPRGFDGYVKKQFAAMKESLKRSNQPGILPLFYLLSVAHGPLTNTDLTDDHLLGESPADLPMAMRRWFRVVEQGDGESADQYWSFAHPRLAQAFANLTDIKANARKYRQRLLAFCADWLNHSSHYAFQYYPAHLREAKQREELYELARDPAFREAQAKALPQEPNLPLQTLRTALLAAADTDDAGHMAEFSLLHARQVIVFAQETPLQALETVGLDRALEIADAVPEPERRVLWHLLLAWGLSRSDDPETALKARKVLQRLRAGEDSLPRLSGWKESMASWLLAFTFEIDPETALRLVQRLLTDEERNDCCLALASRNQFDEASAVACQIEDEWFKSRALSAIAQALAAAGQEEQAKSVFEEALNAARQIPFEWFKSPPLSAIAQTLAAAGQVEEALDAARQIGSESVKSEALSAIAQALATTGRGGEAVRVTELILTDRERQLPDVAAALVEARDADDASGDGIRHPNFKRLLVPCAYHLDAAYRMCGLLAQLYPEQADKVAAVVTAA